LSRKFHIVKKKNLPDEARIVGFSFLKEPTKKEKRNNKFDFIAHANENEIGCKLPKRKAPLAYTKGYVEVDNKTNDFVEVKSRLLIIIILLFGIILGLVLPFTGTGVPVIDDLPIIGDIDISDNQILRPTEPTDSKETPTITFAGYGKCTVSKEFPVVEVKNPEGNFVDMIFTLTDEATGEVIARTGRVPAGKFAYVNVVDFYTEPGVYTVLINVATVDAESGQPMNGMNQKMEVIVE
jgi:hypothetical protein